MSRKLLAGVLGVGFAITAAGAHSAGASTVPPDSGEVATGNGVTDDEIRVAVLNGFTGPVANLAIPAADGMDAYFNMVNEAGGVCGRNIVLERRDTQYDPQIAIQEYRAVSSEVAMLAGVVGGATIFGLSEDIQRDNLALMANTGLESVIPLPNVLMFIAPFALEVVNGVTWAADELAGDDGVLQLGVVYQADAFGEAGMAAAQYVADNSDNVEIVGTATYTPTDQDLTSQAQAMMDSGAEVVWLHVISSQVPKLLGAAAQLGFAPTWVGMSASFASSNVATMGDLLDNYRYVSSTVSYGEDVPGMADLIANYEAISDEPGQDYVVTGWINGSVVAQLLQRACDLGDLTPAGIVAAQVGLEVDNNGVAPNFSYGETPDERIPTRETRVNSVNLETTFGEPVSDFAVSPLAEQWTLADGAQG
jgi:ABC-type branched-subunit amino acid transport system substrate-binding protein